MEFLDVLEGREEISSKPKEDIKVLDCGEILN